MKTLDKNPLIEPEPIIKGNVLLRLVHLIMIGILTLLSASLPNTSAHLGLSTNVVKARNWNSNNFIQGSSATSNTPHNATITFSAFGGSLIFNATYVAGGWGQNNHTLEYQLGNYSASGQPYEFLSTFDLSQIEGTLSSGQSCNSFSCPRRINWTTTGGVSVSAVSANPVNVTITGNGTLSVHMTPLGPISPRVVLLSALLLPGAMILQKRRRKAPRGVILESNRDRMSRRDSKQPELHR